MKLHAKSLIIGLAIAGPLAIGLVGCSGSSDSGDSATPASSTTSTTGTASTTGSASTTGTAGGSAASTTGDATKSTTGSTGADATNGSTGAEPASTTAAGATAEVHFADVQKIFDANCISCHKGANAPGHLDLTTYALAMKGSDHAVIKAGDADGSSLYQHITATHGKKLMPPNGHKLSTAEIKTIHDWIAGGAKNS